jgi:hypothetical protein
METLADIQAGLQCEGLAICTVERESAREVLSGVGDIVEATQVRQRDGASTYLCGREAVPLHTDHPEAFWVAWWCEVQAARDGASVLADGQAILALMGERAKALQEVELHVPPQLPRQVLDTARLWDGERLYYAPWHPVVRATSEGRCALRLFASLLAMGFGHRRIRLQPGDMLVVDNGRWLHGRDKLEDGSGRILRRFWLAV